MAETSMEDGELPPSPGSESNGANRFESVDDDVIIIESVESIPDRPRRSEQPPRPTSGRFSPPLFEIDTSAGGEDPSGPEIELLNVSVQSDSSFVRRSLSTSCLMTFTPPPATPESAKKPKKPTCFNCDGDHMISACPLPHDRVKIKDAADKHRRESMGTPRGARPQPQTPPAGSSEKGYRPGRMSEELREALGIRVNEIPPWIYRMRRKGFMEGYPPSYLKKALILDDDPSRLLSFNFIDDKLNSEEDETEKSKAFIPPKLDRNKIIYYGGFNKYFRDLIDFEGSFRIPPFDVYVNELEKHVQQKAQSEWELQKRSNSRKRKMFSAPGEEPSTSSDDQPSAKRGRLDLEEGNDDVFVSEEVFDGDESLLSLNEASMTSSISDETLNLEIEGVNVPIPETVNSCPFNESANDLSRFTVGIQPFEATVEEAQGTGKFKDILSKIRKLKEET